MIQPSYPEPYGLSGYRRRESMRQPMAFGAPPQVHQEQPMASSPQGMQMMQIAARLAADKFGGGLGGPTGYSGSWPSGYSGASGAWGSGAGLAQGSATPAMGSAGQYAGYGGGTQSGIYGGGGGGMFGSAGSAGPLAAMILGGAAVQGMGDRQKEGGFLSRLQEATQPSPAKNLGLTEGSEFNLKEFGIGTFLPFLNFFREPNTPGQEDGQVILYDLGMSGGRSGNNRGGSRGGGFFANLF